MEENFWNLFKSDLKKRVPRYLLDTLGEYRYRLKKSEFEGNEITETFTKIYRSNHWKNSESVSGPGSTLSYMETIIPEISKLLKLFDIYSMTDAPCGDFNWMRKIDLGQIEYIGLDIVPEIIESNSLKYATQNIKFETADITKDKSPKADILFSRDCLVHFSYDDIFNTLNNFKKSGSTYLLTTSFTLPVLNYNINTGDWRPINLQQPPFNFAPPIYKIDDTSKDQTHSIDLGKILGLWKLNDLTIV